MAYCEMLSNRGSLYPRIRSLDFIPTRLSDKLFHESMYFVQRYLAHAQRRCIFVSPYLKRWSPVAPWWKIKCDLLFVSVCLHNTLIIFNMQTYLKALVIEMLVRYILSIRAVIFCAIYGTLSIQCIHFSFVDYKNVLLHLVIIIHDDVIKWKHFPRNWPFVRGIHRSRWIPNTKASDTELWCLLWSASE